MSLQDLLSAPPATPPKHRCGVYEVYHALPPEDRAAFGEALADRALWTGAALSRTMRAAGLSVSALTIQRHRRGECSCEPF